MTTVRIQQNRLSWRVLTGYVRSMAATVLECPSRIRTFTPQISGSVVLNDSDPGHETHDDRTSVRETIRETAEHDRLLEVLGDV